MNYQTIIYPEYSAEAKISYIKPQNTGIGEYNVMITLNDVRQPFGKQLDNLLAAFAKASDTIPATARPVFKRYFLSDISNQAQYLPKNERCAVSVVGQQPLNGTKVVLWAYLVEDVDIEINQYGMVKAKHGAYTHLWTASLTVPYMSSEVASIILLGDYATNLRYADCTLAHNCVRTWFFVNDVDTNYQGVVTGRNKVFESSGLTVDTHFIASTGIGGKNADINSQVALDAYSVHGIMTDQVRYLVAPSHLNSTYEYGVAFERGTSIDYGNRRHVIISGTASINNKGEIMHPGDIIRQTERMIENITTLLAEADSQWSDVSYGIVYLRDTADYTVVKEIISQRLPDIPLTIVLAPVCRPGWLIEMECAAIKEIKCEYAAY